MSADAEPKTCVAHTEEELLNFKRELACLLKERVALYEVMADAWKPHIIEDVEKYLTAKRLRKTHLGRHCVLEERIERLTKILVNLPD